VIHPLSAILVVLAKELLDNIRDRRSLFYSLIYGTLFLPCMVFGPMIFQINKQTSSYESGRDLYVVGAQLAPNLLNYLTSENFNIKHAGADYAHQVETHAYDLVLEISDDYGDALLNGTPARVTLHYLSETSDSQSHSRHLEHVLHAYNQKIAMQRMLARGLDQGMLMPLDVTLSDLSDENFGSSMLASMLAFVITFSCTMGGFYLAVDVVAGERERNSIEPLLSLAISRSQILLGKFLAILTFCTVSYAAALLMSAAMMAFMPEHIFGFGDVSNLTTYTKLMILFWPLCLLLASAMLLITTYAKSAKEAQTLLGVAMMVPMLPLLVIQFLDIEASPSQLATPVLSQYFLLDRIMMDSTHPVLAMLPGALSTTVVSLILLGIALRLFGRDKMLS